MAKTFDYARLDESDAALLPSLPAPAWTFLHGPRSPVSSTAIRNGNGTALRKLEHGCLETVNAS
jgi:nicotinate-nucleotide adenylyltransferase